MKNKKLSAICILVVALSILFVGCTNKEVVNDYNEYNRLYAEVINEIITESGDKIEKLKEEHVVEKLEQMDEIVDRMSKTASAKKEKSMFSNASLFQEDIIFLRYVADKEDDLTKDEKTKVSGIMLDAERRKTDIEEGNVIH